MELTGEELKKINPCGKVPGWSIPFILLLLPPFSLLNLKIVMHDPNTDIIQWESGAIVLYLIEQYDTEKKLTLDSVKEKAMLYQWLMFQMSGQGPFYGQLSWCRPHLSSIMSHVS